jgi:transposase
MINHKKAMRLYDQGLNDREIAEDLDTSQALVCIWRRRNGLPSVMSRRLAGYQELYYLGLTDVEISKVFGVCASVINEWRLRRGLPCNKKSHKVLLTRYEIADLREEYKSIMGKEIV